MKFLSIVRVLRGARVGDEEKTMICRLATIATIAAVLFQSGSLNCQTAPLDAVRSAFSAHPVANVTLTGTADWYAGSLHDTGTVTLTGSSDGTSQVRLTLDKSGQRTENHSATGPSMKCQWSGADAKTHQKDYFNCLKPAIWFLPSLSLQTTAIPTSISVADLGTESTPEGNLRHFKAQFSPAAFAGDTNALAQLPLTSMDIEVDPNSSLPVTLRYNVRPDSGADVKIPILVKFSDYRNINGVEIPYRIERYVNGTLQLDITLQSSQIE